MYKHLNKFRVNVCGESIAFPQHYSKLQTTNILELLIKNEKCKHQIIHKNIFFHNIKSKVVVAVKET